MRNCLFCQIIRGDISCYKIYEDGAALVFLDPAQDVDGHMIAIPKNHSDNLLDCTPDDLKSLMQAVKTVSNHLVDKCGYNGVNLLNASGKCAGQSIHHFHMHIIPRKDRDGIDTWPKMSCHHSSLTDMQNKLGMGD